MPNSIILFGAGGHAKTCIDVIEASDIFTIIGLVAPPSCKYDSVFGYPVLGNDDDLPLLKTYSSNAFIAFGHFGDIQARKDLIRRLSISNFNFPSVISPYSYVSRRSTLGVGCLISHGAVVNAASSVGNFCIINSQALVEHDSSIGDHTHISTSVSINGHCKIGENSFIGSGAIIRESITLPPSSIISAGKRIMFWPPKIISSS